MKQLIDILLEGKDDNLHEFIQYLKDCSKEGELRSKYNKNMLYDKFISKCDLKANPKPSNTDVMTLYDLLKNDILIKNYLDETGKTELAESDFENWCISTASEYILKDLEINSNNCIYIERAISIPKFSNKDKLYKQFKKDYNGHLGVCWAHTEWEARVYDYKANYDTLIMRGYVRPEDVDWQQTIIFCLNYFNEEHELRLNNNALIQLTNMITWNGEHKIFDGKIIIQA